MKYHLIKIQGKQKVTKHEFDSYEENCSEVECFEEFKREICDNREDNSLREEISYELFFEYELIKDVSLSESFHEFLKFNELTKGVFLISLFGTNYGFIITEGALK